jgi:hypothetical protein
VNEIEFGQELDRVQKTFGAKWFTDVISTELYRRWGDLSREKWAQLCTWVIDHCSFAPRPAKFNEAFEECRGAQAGSAQDRPPCLACDGTGFARAYYRVRETRVPYEGLAPCSRCNKIQLKQRVKASGVDWLTREQYEAARSEVCG